MTEMSSRRGAEEDAAQDTGPRAISPQGVRGALLWLIVTTTLTLALLALAEGAASLILFVRAAARTELVEARAVSSQFDAELGWIARPNFHDPNFYGKGRPIQTDERGLRVESGNANSGEEGRPITVCSGDSFTWGYGVAAEDTWCHLLGEMLGTKTVNLGQSGYGVDQAYLLYMREAPRLDHGLHLFAFIEDDFVRAQSDEFLRYPKPLLGLVDGEIERLNDPLPQDSWYRALRRRLAGPASELRSVRVLNGMMNGTGGSGGGPSGGAYSEVVEQMFARLAEVNRAKSSRLVLILLPNEGMHARPRASRWQTDVRRIADSLRIPFFDLTEELRTLEGSEVAPLFQQFEDMPQEEVSFQLWGGHYSEEGNAWAAEAIQARLKGLFGALELGSP